MKKLTIILSLFFWAVFVEQIDGQFLAGILSKKDRHIDQKKNEKAVIYKVNDESLKNFKKDFGDVSNTTWIKTEDFDEAVFTKEGQTLNAYYDGDGQLVGTTTLKTFADLPPKGQENLRVLFWNYTVEQVIHFKNNPESKTPMKLWDTELANSENYLVEMVYGFRRLVVYVDPDGKVSLFKRL